MQALYGNELKLAFEDILNLSKKYNMQTQTDSSLWNLISPQDIKHDNVGFCAFVINYKGEFKVTSRVPVVLGSVLNNNLANIFLKHPIMQQFRKGSIAGCSKCKHFNVVCRGDRNASFERYGHFFGRDPGCWVDVAK